MKKNIFSLRWLKKNKLNCFTEFGFDVNNNRNIIGINTELEDMNGNDLCRVPGFVKMKVKEFYFRIWVFKYCLSLGTGEFSLERKDRNNFKLLVGVAGENQKEVVNMIDKKDMKINFCISKHCFLNCMGCYNHFSSSKDLSYNNLVRFLKHIRLRGVEKTTLSGGDPLAKKGIVKIIKSIIRMGFVLNFDTVGTPFITNGIVVNDGKTKTIKQIKHLNIFKKIDMIGIPVDGSNNETQSMFRQGRKNLFDEQIKIIEKLEKEGINICVNTVLHKGNCNDMLNLFEVLKRHPNVIKWQIFQFMPIGQRASVNSEKFNISNDDFYKIKEIIMKASNNEFEIIFKGGQVRSHNYMLINSCGDAYKVDLENKREDFGNICDKRSWNNIIENL